MQRKPQVEYGSKVWKFEFGLDIQVETLSGHSVIQVWSSEDDLGWSYKFGSCWQYKYYLSDGIRWDHWGGHGRQGREVLRPEACQCSKKRGTGRKKKSSGWDRRKRKHFLIQKTVNSNLLKKNFFYGCAGSSLLLTFSSCGEWGLLSSCGVWTSHCGGFSRCGLWALERAGSVVVVYGLICPMVVESSWTRDWTHVPCIGRKILNHWPTREVHHKLLCLKHTSLQNPRREATVGDVSP